MKFLLERFLNLGGISIWKFCVTSIRIPMLKIRRSRDHRIFNMGIPIPGLWLLYVDYIDLPFCCSRTAVKQITQQYLGKTVFILRWGPTSTQLALPVSAYVEVVVEHEYSSKEEDELNIKPGDIITNVTIMDGGWWEGDLHGRRGMFPDNFVKVSLSWVAWNDRLIPSGFKETCISLTDDQSE